MRTLEIFKMLLKIKLRSFFQFFYHLLIPPTCELDFCHKKKMASNLLCRDCYRNLISLKVDLYQKPQLGEKFKQLYLYWDYFVPFFYFGTPAQELIHYFKYHYFFSYANLMVQSGLKLFKKIEMFNDFDLVIAVPLHNAKRRLRGYNQSEFIAKKIAENLNIPYSNKILNRIRHRESQTHYSFKKRQKNVENAFVMYQNITHESLFQKKVILVDDVVTTGATTNTCCKVLKQVGVKKILVLSLARAIQSNLI